MKSIFISFSMLMFVMFSSGVFSTPYPNGFEVNFTGAYGSIAYTGPADSLGLGESIGPTVSGSHYSAQLCSTASATITRVELVPIATASSLSVERDGLSYAVYNTINPGIGMILRFGEIVAGGAFSSVNGNFALGNQPITVYSGKAVAQFGGTFFGGLIKTAGHMAAGTYTLNNTTLAKLVCYDANGAIADSVDIYQGSGTITLNATGCTIQSSASSVVNMGGFIPKSFPAVGSLSVSQPLNIQLSCDQDVSLYATVSDQSNLSNRTDIVSLTNESTASGIGIQVFYNGSTTPVTLGPDDSSNGVVNQFYITESSTQGQTISVPLSFQYIRTGDITPGSANGLVGITFSYQ